MRNAHTRVEAQIAEGCAALSGGDILPLGGLFVARAQPGNRPLVLREAEAHQFRWFNYLKLQGIAPIVVLNNAHRIDAQNLRCVVEGTSSLRFVLICQPVGSLRELEAALGLTRESLLGWGLGELASACTAAGTFGSAATLGRLLALTRGMPLYVESAAREHAGDLEQLCNTPEQQTNTAETAQDVVLEKAFDALSAQSKDAGVSGSSAGNAHAQISA